MTVAINHKFTCILLTGKHEYLNRCAILFAEQAFNVLAVVGPQDKQLNEEELSKLRPDFVLSFLNEKILRGALLKCRNVNFHPSPPEWPGRGGASLALYHEAMTYGATAHVMHPKVDAGPILSVRRFSIFPGESCESLFSRAENACLELFYEIVTHIVAHDSLPELSGETWQGQAMTRKQFNEWLILDREDKDDFLRKIRAAKHSQFPGPYVILNGHKFGLVK